MASVQAVFSSTYQTNFMSSLIKQSCGDSLLAVFLSRQGSAIYRPPGWWWEVNIEIVCEQCILWQIWSHIITYNFDIT